MNIHHIAVVGAGIMGNGIAQVCALAGIEVSLIDISEEALEKGLATITGNLERQLRKDSISLSDKLAALGRITLSTHYASMNQANFVIEAASENLELKKRILQQIDVAVGDHCIIATNTSSLSITELAATVSHPEQFIGLHFFNPVPVMSLIEVIRGLQTSEATHKAALALSDMIGKSSVTVRNRPGFVVNRILCPMINEAIFVLQENLASAKEIDMGMQLGCNHPIGPLALADLVGLDTLLAALRSLHEGFDDPKYRPAQLLKEMVAAGNLGRKSGRGFFNYDD
ncbi:3-hydroxybutyryl-CoA dehydrogenase [Pseudomonas sp. NFX98]|uniref:3-hydroxybutyryl-CoA dehydrogenase n=1 Tax=Pseudomonas sp. NFX98 TaxID=3399122 RepID=UPI0039FD5B23